MNEVVEVVFGVLIVVVGSPSLGFAVGASAASWRPLRQLPREVRVLVTIIIGLPATLILGAYVLYPMVRVMLNSE